VSAGLGAAAAFLGCSRRATSEPSADAKGTYAALNAAEDEGSAITVSGGRDAGANANANATRAQVLEWSFGGDASPEARAAVVLPPLGPSERTPLLIALHGRGEARASCSGTSHAEPHADADRDEDATTHERLGLSKAVEQRLRREQRHLEW